MKFKKLLSDWILVKLDPRRTQTESGIVMVGDETGIVRTGVVLMTGSGRQHIDRFVSMAPDIIGQRVAFFKAAMSGHRQGQTLRSYFDEGKGLIRQDDILLVVEGNEVIE